ncbi:alanine racemase [Virgibacillus xinjiangensis]|uniref:Alanine racemase n=1 Tax=Virgibacillus xinjiangensis TaxID=393090 RepID=A0ABV7CW07_9BACI
MENGSYRPTWAEISLDAISSNTKAFKNYIQTSTKMMAVVKGDGYGHGSVQVAETAIEAGADYLSVAILDEAILLRDAGIDHPLLVLGYTPPDAVHVAIKYDITLTVYTQEAAERIVQEAEAQKRKVRVHLKVDSGMNRIGIQETAEALTLADMLSSNYVVLEGVFTHFADADNLDPSYTHKQFERFMRIVDSLEESYGRIPIRHCCNSAGTISHPEKHLDMVRVGISLYGLYPEEHMREKIRLQQAMSLKTKPVLVKTVRSGEPISYGCTYQPEQDAQIATIPIGYADGFSRLLSNRGDVTVRGKRAPIVGRICMDQSMIDITGVDNVSQDSVVTLFGEKEEGYVPLAEVADLMGTIHYETVCLIGKRVPRIYIKNSEVIKKKSMLT